MESVSDVVQAKNWHNIILTYDDSTGINLFLDGIAVASNNDIIDITPSGLLQNITMGSNVTASFDEIKLFDKALNQDEITHLAYEGNYSKNIGNTLHDLRFNELNHTPNELIDDKTKSTFSVNSGTYEDGFVAGSKSIRLQSGGYISLADTNVDSYNGVSISAWINLDSKTNTNQNILKKDGVIDFSVNNGNLDLTLGTSGTISFTDIIPSPPMLNDEKFHFNDPATTFGGARLETIVNPSFYSNKLTLSTWVKNDPSNTSKQNIISIGDKLHIGLNADKSIGCDVEQLSSTTTVTMDVYGFNIENTNYNGDIFNGVGIGTDTITLDVASPNTLMKYKLKRFTFGVPFRNYVPSSLSIVGVDGTTETTFITYPIIFKNPNHVYDIVIDDTNAALDNDKVKIQFNGSGLIKVKNVSVETSVEDSITASITSNENVVTISGNVSRSGTLNVHSVSSSETVVEDYRIPSNLVASTIIGSSTTAFEVTFSDSRSGINNYYLSVENGNTITKFDDLGLSANIFINYIDIDRSSATNYVYADKTDSRSAIQYFTFTRDAYYTIEMQSGRGDQIGSHHFSVGYTQGGSGSKIVADIYLEKGNYIILTNFMGQDGYWQDHVHARPGGAAALIKADTYDDVTNSTKASNVVIFLGGPGSGGHCDRHNSYRGGHTATSTSGTNLQPFGTQYSDIGTTQNISFYTDSAQGGGGKSPNPSSSFIGSGHNGYSRTGNGHATLGNSVPSPFGGGATSSGHDFFYPGAGGFGFFGGFTGGNGGGGGAGSHYWSPTLLKYTTKFGRVPQLTGSSASNAINGYVKLTEIY